MILLNLECSSMSVHVYDDPMRNITVVLVRSDGHRYLYLCSTTHIQWSLGVC